MRIASYNMAQTAVNTYHRQEEHTFESVLIEVKGPRRNSIQYDDVSNDHTDKEKDIEKLKAKNELIDSLMAYLDRRDFSFKEIPPVHFESDESTLNDDIPVLYVKIRADRNQIEISRIKETHIIQEQESLQFTSTGQLTLEDGQSIEFFYELELNRSYYEKNMTMIEKGMIDPIILNLDNKGVDFSNNKIHMDLDLDGNLDTFNMLSQGSGFLVFDKNYNGQVDDGSELFGPKSNHGFSELQAFDDDENHWIDESDVIFKKLKLWTLDEDGKETLISIQDAGIGAIYLGEAKGMFDYKNNHETIARITGSSIYLREDGTPGAVHEVQV